MKKLAEVLDTESEIILRFKVDVDWRGRERASSLIGTTLVYLKEHGLEQAKLGVRAKNEKALGLYQRSGYAITKESRWYRFEMFYSGVSLVAYWRIYLHNFAYSGGRYCTIHRTKTFEFSFKLGKE